jgi:Fic family protein
MRVRVSNDLSQWVRFFLNGVDQTATKGPEVFRQLLALRNEVEHAVLRLGKRAPTARLALNLLYRKPIVSAIDLEQALQISTPTANVLIKALINKDILVEITGQQWGRIYMFDRYLKLFIS